MWLEGKASHFVSRAQESDLGLEAFAVAFDGEIIFETHVNMDMPRNVYSYTKSVLSACIGVAISKGAISLETSIADCFPELLTEQNESKLSSIRLKHLLTMSSGFGKSLLMRRDREAGIGAPDYVSYLCELPMQFVPGSKFCYSTADSILAGRMLEKKTGKPLDYFLNEMLFRDLEISTPRWECCPLGHPLGGGGLYLSLKDMMKFGQLFLDKGCYQGKQLISETWVALATQKQIGIGETEQYAKSVGYGYQFWIQKRPGSFRMHGSYGQDTFVLSKEHIVVSMQCSESGKAKGLIQLLHQEVLDAL